MKKPYKFFIFLFLFSHIIIFSTWAGIDILVAPKVPGGWFETIDYWDLLARAGSNLESEYESESDTESIDISGTTGSDDNWRVDVKKIDSNWDNNLVLSVERMSNGTGQGSIYGGAAYLQLTDTYQTFFSGSGDRSGIYIQCKISGLSVGNIYLDNYFTTIYYTVVDIN